MTREKGDSHQIWVILIANEAWPRLEAAAGFQPAVSPGPGWFMCRLKTCTHVKEKGDSHQIWVTLIANEAWPRLEAAPGAEDPVPRRA
jgi:hypothetical protein